MKTKSVPAEMAKTKTKILVDMIDHLNPGEAGLDIELDESTSRQTFRTIINRHYGNTRTFTMRTTEKGLLVFRLK